MRRPRLFWNFFPAIALLVLTGLVGLHSISYKSLRRSLLTQKAADLKIDMSWIDGAVNSWRPEDVNAEHYKNLFEPFAQPGFFWTVFGKDGEVAADSEKSDRNENLFLQLENKEGKGHFVERYDAYSHQNRYFVVFPLKDKGYLRLAIPVKAFHASLADVYWEWIVGSVVLFFLLLIACLWVTQSFISPLEKIKSAAQQVIQGNYSSKIEFATHVNQEIYDLAKVLTEAAGEMQKKLTTIDKQRKVQAAVLSSMAEGVIAIDDRERVRFINDSAVNLLELHESPSKRQPVAEIIRSPQLLEFIRNALVAESSLELETQYFGKVEKTIHIKSSPLFRTSEHNHGIVIVISDLTLMRRLEAHRKDFVANVSHELRTPLTSIQGYAETLLNPQVKDESERKNFVGIIHRHAQRLSSIVSDLLTLSRLDDMSRSGDVELGKTNAATIVRSAMELCAAGAKEKDMEVKLELKANPSFYAQNTLLEQAVVNLLQNAIKYSPRGSPIKIEVEHGGGEIVFTVKDQGPGIDTSHLERLFERFYRVDKARSREIGGTGLGLSIVKNVASNHGGRVGVKSKIGVGSEFLIAIPDNLQPN